MKIGLSLAMSSANSDTTNSPRKIHNDQKPRRLTLKLSQRRRLSGDSAKRGSAIDSTRAAGALAASSVRSRRVGASTSNLPRFEIDARIDPGVGQVGDQVHDHADKREDVKRREHHRIVAVKHAFEAEQAESVEREDRLDQQRAGEEDVHEGTGKSGNDDQHGVAEYVPVQNLIARAALGAGGEDVLLADLLEERIISQ